MEQPYRDKKFMRYLCAFFVRRFSARSSIAGL
jgi:hypothetical protein